MLKYSLLRTGKLHLTAEVKREGRVLLQFLGFYCYSTGISGPKGSSVAPERKDKGSSSWEDCKARHYTEGGEGN